MPQQTKSRFAYSVALEVAQFLTASLSPATERVQIAGSLRRGRPWVGDVEIVYVPRTKRVQTGLFAEDAEDVNFADDVLGNLLSRGVIGKRLNAGGVVVWGQKNKFAAHAFTGLSVDFFATSEECWFNYLVCRTGPARLNMAIANRAKDKGWQWNPYGCGFSRGDEIKPMSSEAAVFEFVGLPYQEPRERDAITI